MKITQQHLEKGITSEIVEAANQFARELADSEQRFPSPLTTSQMRRFYGEMKRIQTDFKRHKADVPMLKAKLAYAVGRDYDGFKKRAKSRIQEFYDALAPGLDAVGESEARYQNFVKIVEAIVAYHKFHGGK